MDINKSIVRIDKVNEKGNLGIHFKYQVLEYKDRRTQKNYFFVPSLNLFLNTPNIEEFDSNIDTATNGLMESYIERKGDKTYLIVKAFAKKLKNLGYKTDHHFTDMALMLGKGLLPDRKSIKFTILVGLDDGAVSHVKEVSDYNLELA